MIGVIDYKAGNGPSVLNALDYIGKSAALTDDYNMLKKCSHIILPGVGSAGATMSSLRELDLIDFLKEQVFNQKKLFLGICVGLQVLFEHSEEEDAYCLGWFKGEVKKFDQNRVRVPQIGWNNTVFKKQSPITSGLGDYEYFYFVNSYFADCTDNSLVLSETDYQHNFCSAISKDNIFATQFHIEKSGSAGLKMLENFANLSYGGEINAD